MRPKKYNKTNERKVSLNCTVDKWIYEEIEEMARKRDVGRSQITNDLLATYLRETLIVS
jgi:metal-responsive CopG/Arc/MetJ family transcriptional regulator